MRPHRAARRRSGSRRRSRPRRARIGADEAVELRRVVLAVGVAEGHGDGAAARRPRASPCRTAAPEARGWRRSDRPGAGGRRPRPRCRRSSRRRHDRHRPGGRSTSAGTRPSDRGDAARLVVGREEEARWVRAMVRRTLHIGGVASVVIGLAGAARRSSVVAWRPAPLVGHPGPGHLRRPDHRRRAAVPAVRDQPRARTATSTSPTSWRDERWRDFHEVDAAPRRPSRAPTAASSARTTRCCPLLLAVPVGARRLGGGEGRARARWPALLAAVMLVGGRAPLRRAGRRSPSATVARLRRSRRRSRRTARRSTPSCRPRSPSTVAVAALTGPLDRRGRLVARPRRRGAAVAGGEVRAGGRRARRPSALVRAGRRGDRRRGVGAGRRARRVAGVGLPRRPPRRLRRLDRVRRGRPLRRRRAHRHRPSPTTSAARSRLVGLLVDRGFGLAAWAPVFLLAVPALAALVRRRPPGWLALVVPARGRLGHRDLGRAHHARLVVAGPPGRRRPAARSCWPGVVGRRRRPAPSPVLAVAAVAGLVLWGWLRRRGAAGPASR